MGETLGGIAGGRGLADKAIVFRACWVSNSQDHEHLGYWVNRGRVFVHFSREGNGHIAAREK